MRQMRTFKNLLSLVAIAAFLFIAVASGKVNKLHCGSFQSFGLKPEDGSARNYIAKNDGSIIYGNDINWKAGFLSKHEVDIDGQKFKIADVRGYQLKGDYYARMGSDFIKRIVHGRLNVYINQYSSSNYDSKTNRTSYDTRCDHYLQKGETGELTPLASISDIQDAVSDCPKAAGLIDLKYKELRRAVKADPAYLNKVFETYNNECKPKKTSRKVS
jgi:hypothetical protein